MVAEPLKKKIQKNPNAKQILTKTFYPARWQSTSTAAWADARISSLTLQMFPMWLSRQRSIKACVSWPRSLIPRAGWRRLSTSSHPNTPIRSFWVKILASAAWSSSHSSACTLPGICWGQWVSSKASTISSILPMRSFKAPWWKLLAQGGQAVIQHLHIELLTGLATTLATQNLGWPTLLWDAWSPISTTTAWELPEPNLVWVDLFRSHGQSPTFAPTLTSMTMLSSRRCCQLLASSWIMTSTMFRSQEVSSLKTNF